MLFIYLFINHSIALISLFSHTFAVLYSEVQKYYNNLLKTWFLIIYASCFFLFIFPHMSFVIIPVLAKIVECKPQSHQQQI